MLASTIAILFGIQLSMSSVWVIEDDYTCDNITACSGANIENIESGYWECDGNNTCANSTISVTGEQIELNFQPYSFNYGTVTASKVKQVKCYEMGCVYSKVHAYGDKPDGVDVLCSDDRACRGTMFKVDYLNKWECTDAYKSCKGSMMDMMNSNFPDAQLSFVGNATGMGVTIINMDALNKINCEGYHVCSGINYMFGLTKQPGSSIEITAKGYKAMEYGTIMFTSVSGDPIKVYLALTCIEKYSCRGLSIMSDGNVEIMLTNGGAASCDGDDACDGLMVDGSAPMKNYKTFGFQGPNKTKNYIALYATFSVIIVASIIAIVVLAFKIRKITNHGTQLEMQRSVSASDAVDDIAMPKIQTDGAQTKTVTAEV